MRCLGGKEQRSGGWGGEEDGAKAQGKGCRKSLGKRREAGKRAAAGREVTTRCAQPGQRVGRAVSPVLFEKLIRLPEAVVEQHVDASQGQLRVLQGCRRRRVRVYFVPPPRPLLLRAGHGRTRLRAGRGEVREAAAAARAPRAPLRPAGSRAQQPAGGGEGRGGGAAARLRRGERGRPAAPTRRPGLLSSRLEATPAVSGVCARFDPASPEPPPLPAAPPGPGTSPSGPRTRVQAADTHARPKAQSSKDRMDPGRTGRAGELDSGSKNSWSSATERGRTPRWLGLGLQCQNPRESPPTSSRPGPPTRPKAANPRAGGRRGRGLKHLDHLLGPTTNVSAKER